MKNRRAWVEIDLDVLRGNIREIRRHLSRAGAEGRVALPNHETRILVPVKADGYGHGSLVVSRVLAEEGVNFLGVASAMEGEELRSGGITLPILILSPSSVREIPIILREDLIPTVSDLDFAFRLSREAKRLEKKVKVHVEVETGMGRTGVDSLKTPQFIHSLLELRNIEIEGLFTQFSSADEELKTYTLNQLSRFQEVVRSLEREGIKIPYLHTANSAALLDLPETYFNLVRPGLLVYGLSPSLHSNNILPVKPVLSFKTKICQIKEVPKGKSISYGRTFTTERDSLIAVLSVGYGDGYLRSLSNCGEVLIRGERAKVVGCVCMDLTMVDVTEIREVRCGDIAILIGRDRKDEITATQVARWAGTISYEILTSVGLHGSKSLIEKKVPLQIEKRVFSRLVKAS